MKVLYSTYIQPGTGPGISVYYTTTVVLKKWSTWSVTTTLLILHFFIHTYMLIYMFKYIVIAICIYLYIHTFLPIFAVIVTVIMFLYFFKTLQLFLIEYFVDHFGITSTITYSKKFHSLKTSASSHFKLF